MAEIERLLLITERFPPDIGGLARSGARTAGALGRLSLGGTAIDVDVLAWTKSLPSGALETADAGTAARAAEGVTLHRLGLFANWDLSLQHTLNVLEWLQQQRRFDAVWGHYLFPAGFLAVLFGQLAGIPTTVSARGNDIDQMMFPPGDFSRLLWTLQRCDAVTAVSRDLAKKIDVLLGRPCNAIVVPNAVDLDVFAPGPPDPALRQSLGIASDEVVLGFSGELRHKKGFPFMLTALSEIRRTRPACLLIIGEVRAREQTHLVNYKAACPEDAERIVVTGRIDEPADVAGHLRLCDVVLQPSVWDGMPNAVLEAMACERLVLASDAGGIPEAITHEQDGFIIPKAQLNHLGEAIAEILGLSDERKRAVASAARQRIQRGFHADNEAEALARVLTRLAEIPARRGSRQGTR